MRLMHRASLGSKYLHTTSLLYYELIPMSLWMNVYKVPGFGRAITVPIAVKDFPLIHEFPPFFCRIQIQRY